MGRPASRYNVQELKKLNKEAATRLPKQPTQQALPGHPTENHPDSNPKQAEALSPCSESSPLHRASPPYGFLDREAFTATKEQSFYRCYASEKREHAVQRQHRFAKSKSTKQESQTLLQVEIRLPNIQHPQAVHR